MDKDLRPLRRVTDGVAQDIMDSLLQQRGVTGYHNILGKLRMNGDLPLLSKIYEIMANKKTHHLGLIITGTICMVLAVLCLTSFIVTAATGNGVNTDVISNERIWNLRVITNNRDTYVNGVWCMKS